MAYDISAAIADPQHTRDEWRLYIKHAATGDTLYHYLGNGIESLSYAINTENTEKNTIAQPQAIQTNRFLSMSFPAEFEINNTDKAYDVLTKMALLDSVNEEFEVLFVFGDYAVKSGESEITGSIFAKYSKAKFTISAMGGDGVQPIKITSEGKTSGEIQYGYVKLADGSAELYDDENETFVATSFTQVVGMAMTDLVKRT